MFKIALVSENPQRHVKLVERLHTIGVQVVARPSLAEALPLLDEKAGLPAAVVLDSPRHFDSVTLAGLLLEHPHLPLLLFDAPAEDVLGSQLPGQHRSLHPFPQSLAEANSFRLIQEAMEKSLNQPISPIGLPENGAAAPAGQGGTKRSAVYTEDFLRRVGASGVPVLLHGETGAGKEVMARRLWSYSDRAGKPFLKLNCAALPSELIESELFGYEKGAFTGATMDKPGKFELAQNGTILLDEIGDMDIRLQAKLLQVLQDGEVQPLGSSRILSVNVRVMAATHRDLRSAILQGSFREDLYYRLNVISITVPPLRERRHEILSLGTHLLLRHLPEGETAPPITEPLHRAMLAYHWPGNVRELENVMRRLLVYQNPELLAQELMDASALDPAGRDRTASFASNPPCPDNSIRNNSKIDYLAHASREAESKLLLETLDAVRWNRRQAAARLNIDYKAFLYKLQKHGIVESKAKQRELNA